MVTYGCQPSSQVFEFKGETMGTYYAIKYVGANQLVAPDQIDSILLEINNQVSTYIPESLISKINSEHAKKEIISLNESSVHFIRNMSIAEEVFKITDGHYDPTVMPLVNFWGFGYDKKSYVDKDTTKLDSLKNLVGLDQWEINMLSNRVELTKPQNAELDFSATAKGYAIDYLGEYLESAGVYDYFIDIGGESKAFGNKPNEQPWIVGINTPKEDSELQDIALLIHLNDASIATSGNYRNYYVENGQKFVHTVDPKSGRPFQSNLLSASIISDLCAAADGFATACMVMGLEDAQTFINTTNKVEGILIYSDENGNMKKWYSHNCKDYIIEENPKE